MISIAKKKLSFRYEKSARTSELPYGPNGVHSPQPSGRLGEWSEKCIFQIRVLPLAGGY